MASYLSWGANSVLFAAGCFLAADTATGIFAEILTPPPVGALEQVDASGATERGWSQRQAILDRNLFNASTLHPEAAEVVIDTDTTEDLEKTTLPLRLLGTVASGDPEVARAALEDTEQRERLVVKVGDRIKERATVYRIERRRVLLAENDALRELTLDDENPGGRVRAPPSVRSAARKRRPSRRKPPVAIPRQELENALRDPTNLFQQARFLPKFDGGEMQGLQISAIKPGSLVEDAGLQEGDLITQANGIPIDTPQASQEVFRELAAGGGFSLEITRADGSTETIDYSVE